MSIAEEVAAIWQDVKSKPEQGKAGVYYADLLRKTMESKRRIEQSGRRHSVLPELRDLVRKKIVRVPAEHVGFLEISAFDLIANPLKKSLQSSVEYLTEEDRPLVEWFVQASKKDTSLAIDVKILESWLAQNYPKVTEIPADRIFEAS